MDVEDEELETSDDDLDIEEVTEELDLVAEDVDEDELAVFEADTAEELDKGLLLLVRYQLFGASPRHSPTGTEDNPRVASWASMKSTKCSDVSSSGSWHWAIEPPAFN